MMLGRMLLRPTYFAALVSAFGVGCSERGAEPSAVMPELLAGGSSPSAGAGVASDAAGAGGRGLEGSGSASGGAKAGQIPSEIVGAAAAAGSAEPPVLDAGRVAQDSGRPRVFFDNPLNASSGADPWMTYYEGRYYLMATTWGSTLTMAEGASIAELKESEPRVIWSADDPDRCCNMWAPEFHLLDGPNGRRWYVYFTAGRSGNDFGFQRLHVLESAALDPRGPYTYRATFYPNAWVIDGSILELAGNLYLLFSASQGTQNIYIAPLSNPWTVSGPRVLLSRPELPWESLGDFPVNEAPVALEHAGRTFLVYSASHCASPEYKLGLLELSTDDPLAPGAWVKSPEPVFQQAPALGVFGPGHNGFFKSPDGSEDWLVYHANASPGAGCYLARTTRIQPLTWNADGTPNFGVPVPAASALPVPAGE